MFLTITLLTWLAGMDPCEVLDLLAAKPQPTARILPVGNPRIVAIPPHDKK